MSGGAVASFDALGTTAVLAVAHADALSDAHAILAAELDAVDRACSRFRDDSELVALHRAGGRSVAASPLLCEAIEVGLAAAHTTNGLVDPALGRTLRLAGYDRTFVVVARREGSAFAPRFVPSDGAWREIEVDREAGRVRVPDGIELDLGATAKALAADRAARRILEETGSGALVSLGGDIAVAGEAPRGGWPVRIADDHAAPLDGDGPVVALSTGGLATSSVAARRWETASGELHHIVDPRTGRPAVPVWRTVSVAARSCVDANVASTAAVVLGAESPDWLEQRGLPSRLVRPSGDVLYVGGWPEDTP